jgi:hypothetical protein
VLQVAFGAGRMHKQHVLLLAENFIRNTFLINSKLISFAENYWIITDLSPSLRYVFRVRSINKYGWSNFSVASESFDFTEAAMLAKQQQTGIVLSIVISVIVGVALCVTGTLVLIYSK